MTKQNSILIGKDTKSLLCAFGDDSAYGETLVFATALLPRPILSEAQGALSAIMQKYKIPAGKLHCRILFSGDQRRKAGISHLDIDDVNACFHEVLIRMQTIGVICRFSHATKPKKPFLVKKDEQFPVSVPVEDKIIQTILAKACIHLGEGAPPPAQIECYYSADPTKIKFTLEGQNQQVHLGYKGFTDVGAPSGMTNEFIPHIATALEQPLLQVADVYAYLAAHGMEEQRTRTQGFFWNHLNHIRLSKATMTFNLEDLPITKK